MIHGSHNIDIEAVWRVVSRDVFILLERLRAIERELAP
jgi:uncharacterized protein with HEPN domain